MYEVSVTVLCYNPEWRKLKETILSILGQEGVSYEIIVSDDASAENEFARLEALFSEYGFKDYKLIGTDENTGTCRNYVRALEKAEGKYIKGISPGDCLYRKTTLAKWIEFMKKYSVKVSFGRAVYYSGISTEKESRRVLRNPQLISIYLPERWKPKTAAKNNIFLNDSINGASFLIEKELFAGYIKKIVGKIKYTEDLIYKKMLTDGIAIYFFDENVVWYEYGEGISTSNMERWGKIYREESRIMYDMIKKENTWKAFDKIRLNAVLGIMGKKKAEFLKFIIFPSLIYWEIIKIRNKAYLDVKKDFNI